MGRINVDKSEEFIKSGMTLASESGSDKYLKSVEKKIADKPVDRNPKP